MRHIAAFLSKERTSLSQHSADLSPIISVLSVYNSPQSSSVEDNARPTTYHLLLCERRGIRVRTLTTKQHCQITERGTALFPHIALPNVALPNYRRVMYVALPNLALPNYHAWHCQISVPYVALPSLAPPNYRAWHCQIT
jgi:hypothetical protein